MMMVLKLSVLAMVGALALLAGSGESVPTGRARHWDHWRKLQQQIQEQNQAQQQQQQQMAGEQPGRRWSGIIREAAEQRRLVEQMAEQEEQQQELMEDLISSHNLEKFALQLKLDTLGRILSPLLVNDVPTSAPPPTDHENCVTRTAPVSFFELGLSGHFVYTVCGSGDGASMHIHFQKLGATTPTLDTTTTIPKEATTITTPVGPLCPSAPTPSPTTPTDLETTTSTEADITTTTAAA